LKINVLLGKLYKGSGVKRHAITSYSAILSANPSNIEAIEALVQLGLDAGEINRLIDESCRSLPDEVSSIYSDGWLHSVVAGLVNKRNCDVDKCQANFLKLLHQFPRNCYILSQLARATFASERFDDSLKYFRQLRKVDPNQIDYLDQYGYLLLKARDESELNRLAHEVLAISGDRPEGWLIVAMYCELKGEVEKSMQFIDRVRYINCSLLAI
jgi:tetratricopeptide (TPR) repeat protein